MNILRWLWPGIGVKRWIAVFALGIVLVGLGVIVMLGGATLRVVADWVRDAAYLLTGSLMTPFVRGLFLLIPGLILIGSGASRLFRAVITVLFPETGRVGDVIYQRKYLERGPRIVAIGGGTGLSTLLRGLKTYTSNITAIVTVTDDGGSSGRLRGELGVPPPGDIRNCLVALADTESLMESLFQHRFERGGSLEGHSFGNLFIAAMAQVTGDFEQAVRESSRVLAIRGRVLPSTNDNAVLNARFADGSLAAGESAITGQGKAIDRVWLAPVDVRPLGESLRAINAADLIVVGPGSVFTSIIPNLLVEGIPAALAASRAPVVYVANIMTEHGETDGYTVIDHWRAINDHAGRSIFDVVIENSSPVPAELLAGYAVENAKPVPPSHGELERQGVRVVRVPLLAPGPLARHDPDKLAQTLMTLLGRKRAGRDRVSWLSFMWFAERMRSQRRRQSNGKG